MKTVLKIFIGLFLLSSCGGGKDSPSVPNEEAKQLGAFDLVFPDNNLVCTEGDDAGDNEITIEFLWSISANATSYELEIINQESGDVTTQTSTTAEKIVTLKKNTQYSWKVSSKLGEDTKASTQWSFYTEGIAVENYAPFPAEIIIVNNTNGTVNITWTGSDIDDDIESYDIFLGTDSEPALYLEDTQNVEINNFSIESNIIYYLKVITNDSNGNSSTSARQFMF